MFERIIRFAIEQRWLVIVSVAAMAILGVFSYQRLSIDAVPALCEKFGGVCFPAHIDRPANGILAVFGLLPDTPVFPTLEVHDPEKFFADPANEAYRAEHRVLTSSDAHRLGDMAEAAHFLELPENSFAALRAAIRAGVR